MLSRILCRVFPAESVSAKRLSKGTSLLCAGFSTRVTRQLPDVDLCHLVSCRDAKTPFDHVSVADQRLFALAIANAHPRSHSLASNCFSAVKTLSDVHQKACFSNETSQCDVDLLQEQFVTDYVRVLTTLMLNNTAAPRARLEGVTAATKQPQQHSVSLYPIRVICNIGTRSSLPSGNVVGSSREKLALARIGVGKVPNTSIDGYHLVVSYSRPTNVLVRFGWLQAIDFYDTHVVNNTQLACVPQSRADLRLFTLISTFRHAHGRQRVHHKWVREALRK